MSNLLNNLIEKIGEEELVKTGERFNLKPDKSKKLSAEAISVLIGGLAKNMKDSEKADKVMDMLDEDKALIKKNSENELGILRELFNNKENKIFKGLAKSNLMKKHEVKDFMVAITPLLMGAIAQTAKETNMDKKVLSTVLEMAGRADLKRVQNSKILSIIDLDKDGRIGDDLPKILGLLSKLFKFFGSKKPRR